MRITVSQLRRIIKEEVQRTLGENKLSGSMERVWNSKKEELASYFDLDMNDPIMKAAGVDLRRKLASGIHPDKAFEMVAFAIEDAEYGQIPGFEHTDPEVVAYTNQQRKKYYS